jgi:hypothetical protein
MEEEVQRVNDRPHELTVTLSLTADSLLNGGIWHVSARDQHHRAGPAVPPAVQPAVPEET